MRTHTSRRAAAMAGALALMGLAPASAQERGQPFPGANLVLTGYGGAEYSTLFEPGDNDLGTTNDFTASISPILLFQMGEDLLFESEFEFGLSGETTTSTLEYAQIDYLGFENVVLVAGKFLLPFGLFSERLHASWVNKLPNAPLLYGHAHGGVAETALLPVLSDAGVMARYKAPLGSLWSLDVSLFVTQGPRMVTTDEEPGAHVDAFVPSASLDPVHDDPGTGGSALVPQVAFGTSFADNNNNKLLGGRLGLVRAPRGEVYVSGFHAMYDADNYLDLVGANLAAEVRLGGFELRGEGALLRQEFTHADAYEKINRLGYYLQVSRALDKIEPVLRWGQLLAQDLEGAVVQENRRRMAAGAIYWIGPASPLKLMYEWDSEGQDAVVVQWAFGF